MAYTITSVKYLPRKPKLTIEADSLDDLAELTEVAEGSTAIVGGDTYEYDSVNGWVIPGSGGGGGGGGGPIIVTVTPDASWETFTADKSFAEILSACQNGNCVIRLDEGADFYDQFTIYSYGPEGVSCLATGYLNLAPGATVMVTIASLRITPDGITYTQGSGNLS